MRISISFFLLAYFLISCSEEIEKKEEELALSEFSPEKGGEGDLITLSGSNFSENKYQIEVKFGNLTARVESSSKDKLIVRLPNNIDLCGEVVINVKSDENNIYSKNKFTLLCPMIESFTPASGDPGDIITINGSYFNSNTSRIKVTIGAGEAEVIAASASVLNVKLLNGYSGYYPIKVKIIDKEVLSADLFKINGPLINSFTPAVVNGCGKITISGLNFSPIFSENKVYFNYKEGIVESATSNQLVVKPPYDLKEIANIPVTIFINVHGKIGFSSSTIILEKTAWPKMESLDDRGRSDGIGFSIANKGYAGLGSIITSNGYAELKKDFWEYSEVLNTWSKKMEFPGEARLKAVGFAIADKGYLGLGGDHSNILFNDFWEFNPTANSWLRMPDFPGSSRVGAISFSVNGKGYVGLGDGFGNTNDIWMFDPEDKSWLKVTEYPGAGTSGMICFVINDKAYIGSGFLTNDFWEFNSLTNQWRPLNNFPETYVHYGVSFAFNDFGIVGTGAGPNGYRTDHVWKYDPRNDSWYRLSDFGGEVRNYAIGFPLENGFMIGTGSTSFNSDSANDFYKYVCE